MKSAEPKKPMKEMMADCTLATKKDFRFEDQLLRNIAGINIELFVLLSECGIRNRLQLAVITLTVKNFRLLQCINDCIFNGYYEVGMTLLRVLYENLLLMQYFINNENEAGKWLKGKKFRAGFIRSKVMGKSEFYSFVSDYYIHANLESLVPVIESFTDQDISLILYPGYSREKCALGLSLSIIYGWLNNLHLQYAFRQYLWEDEAWKKGFIGWNEVMIRYMDEKLINRSAIRSEFAEKIPEPM